MTEPIKHETDPVPGEGEGDDERSGESVAELYNRQHDYFGCEGPGLGSMLRVLADQGMRLPMPGQAGAEVGALGGENVLVAFRREVEAAVRTHSKPSKRWWARGWRW